MSLKCIVVLVAALQVRHIRLEFGGSGLFGQIMGTDVCGRYKMSENSS